jgi:hypothetical protein
MAKKQNIDWANYVFIVGALLLIAGLFFVKMREQNEQEVDLDSVTAYDSFYEE